MAGLKQTEAVLGSILQLRPGLTLNMVVLDFGQPKLFYFMFSRFHLVRDPLDYLVFVS